MRTFFEKFNRLKETLKARHWDIKVPPEERQERLDICAACDAFNEKIEFCKECGCHVPSKSIFYFSECPRDKWPINVK